MESETNTENKKSILRDKWIAFGNVIGDPWVVILLIATFASYIAYLVTPKNNNEVALTVINTITNICAGLLGGVIANRWAQATEVKVLATKGRSAIRSLKLILLNVAKIENRVSDYIGKIPIENVEHKFIVNTYEEVVEKCNIVQEEIISSIENWTDILPEEANIKTQIGVISQLKLEKEAKERELGELNNRLLKAEATNHEEIKSLQEMIQKKSSELALKNKKITELESKNFFWSLDSKPTLGTSQSTVFFQPSVKVSDVLNFPPKTNNDLNL